MPFAKRVTGRFTWTCFATGVRCHRRSYTDLAPISNNVERYQQVSAMSTTQERWGVAAPPSIGVKIRIA